MAAASLTLIEHAISYFMCYMLYIEEKPFFVGFQTLHIIINGCMKLLSKHFQVFRIHALAHINHNSNFFKKICKNKWVGGCVGHEFSIRVTKIPSRKGTLNHYFIQLMQVETKYGGIYFHFSAFHLRSIRVTPFASRNAFL